MPLSVNLEHFKAQSNNKSKENKLFLEKLRKRKPGDLDNLTLELHHKAFSHIDCLDCANCCKTTSPIVIDRDIDRLAKRLKMKPSQVVDLYLRLDEDGDYVFREVPFYCPTIIAWSMKTVPEPAENIRIPTENVSTKY